MPEQCQSHKIFEQMMHQSIDNLAEKLTEGIRVFSEQSANNGNMLQKVLENQADRREMCGKQTMKLEQCEHDIEELKNDNAALRKENSKMWRSINIGIGAVLMAQVVVAPIIIWLVTNKIWRI